MQLDNILANVLERKDSEYLRKHYELFINKELQLKKSLHLEALYQTSLAFLFELEYWKAFQTGFFLKEIAGDKIKSRELIIELIDRFVKNEKEFLTITELDLFIEEVSAQYKYLKIYDFDQKTTQKFNGFLYYLKTVREGLSINKVEGKYDGLFKKFNVLFLQSNSTNEAWDRAALEILKSHRI